MSFCRKLFASIAGLILALWTLAAEADNKKIGLALSNLEADFFNQIKQSVEAYGAEKGLEVISVNADGDSATQIGQVRDLVAQGIDALIYLPASAADADVPTKLARAQGVPVVNVDRNPKGAPGDAFIATDSVAWAKRVCDFLIEKADGKGKMLMIHGQKGTTPEVDRAVGCSRSIAEAPGVDLVGEQWSERWSPAEGFETTRDLLETHPDVTIIFAHADGLALGAAEAIKASGLPQKIWLGGFDGDTKALEAIRDGVYDVTATQQTRRMGRTAVDLAIRLMNGENVPPVQLLDATLTTKENAQGFMENHP